MCLVTEEVKTIDSNTKTAFFNFFSSEVRIRVELALIDEMGRKEEVGRLSWRRL